MSALAVRFDRGGVFLPDAGLWLDPHDPKAGPERVFISHAHSDHIGLHREVILSAPTAKLVRARLHGEWREHVLPYGEPAEFEGPHGLFKITLLPAGHIFGSAMSLVEMNGASVLYTGDFKLRRGLSAEACEPRLADVLIMETTYGQPAYRFPAAADVMRAVVRFCREALDNEETPVLLGYSLGKSQELLCGLVDAGLPIMLHGAVHRLTKLYEQFGQCFPLYEKYDSSRARHKVLICPPNVAGSALLRHVTPARTAVLTGWAVDPNCRYRYQTHAAFALSDHADFPELIEMVRQVRPKQVYTLHGFAADFAQTLRELGFKAQALSEDEQLTLPLVMRADSSPHPGTKASAIREAQAFSEGPAEVAAPPPVSPSLSFETFARVCADVAATPKKLEKTAHLAAYLKTLDEPALRAACAWFTGYPFPPVENKVLQLGWAVIRDALCQVAQMSDGEFGGCYLKHSDLGETAFEILSLIPRKPSTLSLSDGDALFGQLHLARGPSGKVPLLAGAFRRATALEGKYLVKILTGDLRIGLKEGLVEEAIAHAFGSDLAGVKSANLIVGNVGETAVLAKRGTLSQASLVPFRPLKFMLASPEETAQDIWDRVLGWARTREGRAVPEIPLPIGPIQSPPVVWIEDKYDGIRCQLHKVATRTALYSRDLKEITTPFLDVADLARTLPDDMILDGELVAMRDNQVLSFADLQRRIGRREGDLFFGQQIPVQFVAFDLLWLNGESWINQPLHARRTQLEQVAQTALRLAQITRAHSADEIEAAFADARERGNEGLMIKDPASLYSPGRRGLAWLKLKKAYATLDCVVVGAEYGHGKRKDVLSDYTFAVRDEATGTLHTIGKAYIGLTDAEIVHLTHHFRGKAIRQHGRHFEVEPDTVLEIAFDAVQTSKRHSSGLALRFPRIVRIRTDKTSAQIDTLQTARSLVRKR